MKLLNPALDVFENLAAAAKVCFLTISVLA
jgi:hypothetical protein